MPAGDERAHAPWYVVPADDNENARLIVSQIVLDALKGLKMAYPKTTEKRRAGIEIYRQGAREIALKIQRKQTQQTEVSPHRAVTNCGELEGTFNMATTETPHQR